MRRVPIPLFLALVATTAVTVIITVNMLAASAYYYSLGNTTLSIYYGQGFDFETSAKTIAISSTVPVDVYLGNSTYIVAILATTDKDFSVIVGGYTYEVWSDGTKRYIRVVDPYNVCYEVGATPVAVGLGNYYLFVPNMTSVASTISTCTYKITRIYFDTTNKAWYADYAGSTSPLRLNRYSALGTTSTTFYGKWTSGGFTIQTFSLIYVYPYDSGQVTFKLS
ncbi:MAG: hypothetical protein ABWK05_07060 [Pyrobaculum sp.]